MCGQAQARSTDEVLRIAFRAWGGREFAVTMLTPSIEPRDKLEAAALRILATSWPVRRAAGEVTVAVPPMMSPARGRTGRPGGAGEAGRSETWRAAPIRYVQSGCALIERRCPCLFEAAGAALASSISEIARSGWRVIAVLTSVPGRTSLVAGLTKTGR